MSKNSENEKRLYDEKRLYECARKFGIIVKQFDELVEIMNNRTRPQKPRKNSKVNNASANSASSSSQPDSNEALIQTITRFLNELKANPTESD